MTPFFFVTYRAMASNKTIGADIFFQTVSSGSIFALWLFLIGHEEQFRIANYANSEGETPLIVAIKGNHNDMFDYLVSVMGANVYQLGQFMWKGLDYSQVPPLFAAVLCETNIKHRIIYSLIDYDLTSNNCKPGCIDAIMSSSLTQTQKVNVLKLLGAVYILEETESRKSVEFGLHYWSNATSIRLEGVTSPPKPHQVSEWAGKVFGDVIEFETLVELHEILNRPVSEDHLNLQALLIVHRVMSEICPHPCPYFSLSFLRFAESLVINHLYSRAIEVVMLSVESLRDCEWTDAIDSEWPFKVVDDCLENLRVCLSQQKNENLALDSPNRLQFPLMMEAFRCFSSFHSKLLILRGDRFHLLSRQIVLKMVKCIKCLPLLNPEDSIVFKQWLSSYIALIECHPRVHTLLHAVCKFKPPVSNMIQLLLKAGACPFATDEDGLSPLFYLSHARFFNETAVRLLLNAGAHLDQLNEKGTTPLENLKSLQLQLARKNLSDPYLDSLCNTFFSLQCLCVQAISQSRIPYQNLPPGLKTFVTKH